MFTQKYASFIVMGIALGYSDESIIKYLRRRYEPGYIKTFKVPGEPFYSTGYISTEAEDRCEEETIRLINSRRLVSTPFPKLNDQEILGDNLKALRKHEVVLKRYPVIISKLDGINLIT